MLGTIFCVVNVLSLTLNIFSIVTSPTCGPKTEAHMRQILLLGFLVGFDSCYFIVKYLG